MPEIASPNSNTNRDSTQPVDLLDCNKGGLTQLARIIHGGVDFLEVSGD